MLIVLTTVVFIDQLSKYLVQVYRPEWVVINSGAAFGLKIPEWVVVGIFVFIALYGLILFDKRNTAREKKIKLTTVLGFILGGSLSNLADRFIHGGVVDFIRIPYWPSFNIADSAIVIGTLLLLWYSWGSKSTSNKNDDDTSHVREQSALHPNGPNWEPKDIEPKHD